MLVPWGSVTVPEIVPRMSCAGAPQTPKAKKAARRRVDIPRYPLVRCKNTWAGADYTFDGAQSDRLFRLFCGTVSSGSVKSAPGTVMRRGLAYFQSAPIGRLAGEP